MKNKEESSIDDSGDKRKEKPIDVGMEKMTQFVGLR